MLDVAVERDESSLQPTPDRYCISSVNQKSTFSVSENKGFTFVLNDDHRSGHGVAL
jgi:hypothetical protein